MSDAPADEQQLTGDALRQRYREERDKRIRPEGNDQYLEPTGRFAHFLDDPYVAGGGREPRATTRWTWSASAAVSPVWSPPPG